MQSAYALLYFYLTCPAVPHFPHNLKNSTIFGKRGLIIKCLFLFYLKCWSSCKYSCQIKKNLNFPDKFWKNTQIPNFTKIRPLGAQLPQADGWTGMMKLVVVFCNFAKAPKNEVLEDTCATDINIKTMSVKNMYCFYEHNN